MPSSKTTSAADYTFKDGTFITETDLQQAKTELTAFLLFLGKGHNFVLRGHEDPVIKKSEIIAKLPGTSPEWLLTAACQQINQIKSQVPLKAFTEKQRSDLRMGNTTRRILATGYIQDAMQPIAGRPDGWTLLGMETEKELIKLVRDCYGEKAAYDVSKDALIPYQKVLQLLARKNSLAAARPAAGKQLKKSKPAKQRKVVPVAKTTVKKKIL